MQTFAYGIGAEVNGVHQSNSVVSLILVLATTSVLFFILLRCLLSPDMCIFVEKDQVPVL